MSGYLWAYLPESCDGEPCPGDCDKCLRSIKNTWLMGGWHSAKSAQPKENGLYQVLLKSRFPSHPMLAGTEYDFTGKLYTDMATFKDGSWCFPMLPVDAIVAYNPVKLLEVPEEWDEE